MHLERDGIAHSVPVILPISEALSALPCLTSLTCTRLLLSFRDLIDIAAHATLERIELHIDLHAAHDNTLLWWQLPTGVDFLAGGQR